MFESDVLTVEDVTRLLGLSRNTVYKMAGEGTLPSYRVGRKLRFSARDLADFMASARAASPARPADPEPATAPEQQPRRTLQDAAQAMAPKLADPLVLASDDVLGGFFAHLLSQRGSGTVAHPMSSYAGLVSLYSGMADMALVNLYDFRSNSYNVPYVQRLCPGTSVTVMRLLRRKQGLFVAAGNPRGIRSWGALARDDVRLASRERGCGARVLQDQKLLALEASMEDAGRRSAECATAAEAISRVSQGAADACVGYAEEVGPIRGVQFLPLQTECVDLVVRKDHRTRDAIRSLRQMLEGEALRQRLQLTLDCDASVSGAIAYEC
ncbi:MAG: helix-turn-helix transcriptional regulator [Coriobacteriia bacterium]|nr:helix-turn-helix transcriptional regulator [Coriobacteriia bacterium]